MHSEILNSNQKKLLPLVRKFSSLSFYLVGGTALALQLGHRESIDFDLFTFKSFNHDLVLEKVRKSLATGYSPNPKRISTLVNNENELTFMVNNVKMTFYRFPFEIPVIETKLDIKMPDEITIGAMKAYALGRRKKWKDYVDIYFILNKYTIEEISNKAESIFGSLYSEKLFRVQLCYFDDIDYTEEVTWKVDNPPTNTKIKNFLTKVAV